MFLSSALVFMMTIVITKEQITEDVPLGVSEEEMVQYFRDLGDGVVIGYYNRQNSVTGTVSHELQDDEAGYYIVTIRGVRNNWWRPSFGRVLIPLVVISNEGKVAEIKFFGGRVGWP
mgnify:CR=1 FL=1